MQVNWFVKDALSNGQIITVDATEVQIAQLLGSQSVAKVVAATKYPTKHEAEWYAISQVKKEAELDGGLN